MKEEGKRKQHKLKCLTKPSVFTTGLSRQIRPLLLRIGTTVTGSTMMERNYCRKQYQTFGLDIIMYCLSAANCNLESIQLIISGVNLKWWE